MIKTRTMKIKSDWIVNELSFKRHLVLTENNGYFISCLNISGNYVRISGDKAKELISKTNLVILDDN